MEGGEQVPQARLVLLAIQVTLVKRALLAIQVILVRLALLARMAPFSTLEARGHLEIYITQMIS